ncbi:acyltransferase family protein [Sphingomonas sp. ASV193]|uniref:acyltransferase family protein n=1 Tax=Sphingomonas sp. ASV193 TaxID=3144405 RepID=UPI0032E8DA20
MSRDALSLGSVVQDNTVAPAKSTYRGDIQALRGLAVLAVLLYHSGLGIARAGYLGVDLFFVVSGFLITGIIARQADAGRFSFASFYIRRARRILPATFVTLLVVTLAAIVLLSSRQYAIFLKTLLGSLGFSANYVLWGQTGYFHPDSEFEPLLHMWSLGIEEQYYLLFPLLLILSPRRWWLTLLGLAGVASLGGAAWLWFTRPSVAFFWLPFRAWELAIGSMAALVAGHAWTERMRRLVIPSVLLLVAAMLVPTPGPPSALGSLLTCLLTAIVILGRRPVDRAGVLAPVIRAGDISFSLYLVHWPLFAFARVAFLSRDLPLNWALGLIIASLVLAELSYRLVEEPVRGSSLGGWRLAATVFCATAALAGLGVAGSSLWPYHSTTRAIAPVAGLGADDCFNQQFRFTATCRTPGTPTMLLWGDSYSAHVAPGLASVTRRPFIEASAGHCSPFTDYVGLDGPQDRDFARQCLTFNRAVMRYLEVHPEIQVVVLSAQYFRTVPPFSAFALAGNGEQLRRAPLGVGPTLAAQKRLVDRLHKLRKRVVVIGMTPPADADLGECWIRAQERRPTLSWSRCRASLNSQAATIQAYRPLLDGFEVGLGIPVIRLDQGLCDRQGECRFDVDGQPVYRDDTHLSVFGSTWLAHRMHWGERIEQLAR